MLDGTRLFTVGGIEVRVTAPFFLTLGLLAVSSGRSLTETMIWVSAATFSILWHEFGHATAFRSLGHQAVIKLWGFGGLTSTREPVALSLGRRFVAVAAGPGAGLLLGGSVLLLAREMAPILDPLVVRAASDLVWINIYWSLLNLVPILPLDGGQLMAVIVERVSPGRSRLAHRVSLVLAALGMATALLARDWWIAFLLLWMGGFNAQQLGARGVGRQTVGRLGSTAAAVEQEEVHEGARRLAQGDIDAALRHARKTLGGPGPRQVKGQAALVLVWGLLLLGRVDEATAVAEEWAGKFVSPASLRVVLAGALGPQLVESLRRVVEGRPGDALTLQLIHALVESDHVDEAQALLATPSDQWEVLIGASLVQDALYLSERFQDAATLGERTLEKHPHPVIAYNVACTYARLARKSEALSFLDRAIELGFRHEQLLDTDSDLDPLRGEARFRALRARLHG